MVGRYTKTPIERFFEKVATSKVGCWEWLAGKTWDGYGSFGLDGVVETAHRISFKLARGPIPKGKTVCHHCDNRKCVRPSHLFLGSNAQNTADRNSKGRQARGITHASAKLSEADVLDIRASKLGTDVIAKRRRVSRRTIQSIRSRKTWKHI